MRRMSGPRKEKERQSSRLCWVERSTFKWVSRQRGRVLRVPGRLSGSNSAGSSCLACLKLVVGHTSQLMLGRSRLWAQRKATGTKLVTTRLRAGSPTPLPVSLQVRT